MYYDAAATRGNGNASDELGLVEFRGHIIIRFSSQSKKALISDSGILTRPSPWVIRAPTRFVLMLLICNLDERQDQVASKPAIDDTNEPESKMMCDFCGFQQLPEHDAQFLPTRNRTLPHPYKSQHS